MIKIFLDGGDILANTDNPLISGFTTNPTICKKLGITNYKDYALKILPAIKGKSLSIEVLSDDLKEMISQAKEIASWGDIYVKIPITNTKGQSTYHVIEELTILGVKVNVTAIMTVSQARLIIPALKGTKGAYLSVFAGRIADTGVNPVPVISSIRNSLSGNIELLWASPREVFNIYQAEEVCDIITCSQELINKLSLKGKDLAEYSLETVQQFYRDGQNICVGNI